MMWTTVWTVVAMEEDIQTLRQSVEKQGAKEMSSFVRSFCVKHHARAVISSISLFYISMSRMGNLACSNRLDDCFL